MIAPTHVLRIVVRAPPVHSVLGVQINVEMDKFRQTALDMKHEVRTLEEANRSLSEK